VPRRSSSGSVSERPDASTYPPRSGSQNPTSSVGSSRARASSSRTAALAHLAYARPGPDYVEALVRTGRCDEARTALEELSASTPSERAAAARCRGLIDAQFGEHFAQALVWHALAPDEFETARTLFCLGGRLRRDRRRREARPPLRAALEAFERLDARGWAARARDELDASGQTIRPRDSWDERR
jgi:hypothetical protein